MNRQLKFRAWDALGKKWIIGTSNIHFANGIISLSSSDKNQFTLCQFTGLVDKWKKEIYEGDIVKVHNMDKTFKNGEPVFDWRIFEIIWNVCTWAYSNSVLYIPMSDYDLTTAKPFDIEIIGNIFESKELVEQYSLNKK